MFDRLLGRQECPGRRAVRAYRDRLDEERRLIEAHTFAFDYESGQVTRFEQDIEGGPVSADGRSYAGTISGGGLEGKWRVTELGPTEDEATEAAHAFGIGVRLPVEQTPAPVKLTNED